MEDPLVPSQAGRNAGTNLPIMNTSFVGAFWTSSPTLNPVHGNDNMVQKFKVLKYAASSQSWSLKTE